MSVEVCELDAIIIYSFQPQSNGVRPVHFVANSGGHLRSFHTGLKFKSIIT